MARRRRRGKHRSGYRLKSRRYVCKHCGSLLQAPKWGWMFARQRARLWTPWSGSIRWCPWCKEHRRSMSRMRLAGAGGTQGYG